MAAPLLYRWMTGSRTTLERAYDLANSGECAGVAEIKARLKAEGYTDTNGQLYGASIGKDLRRLCGAARARPPEA